MAIAIQRLPEMRTPVVRAVSDRAFGGAVFFYFLGVVLPSEFAVNLFGLALIPVRVVLLVFFVPALIQLTKDRDFRPQAFDYFLIMAIAWMLFALCVNNGVEKGIKYGGSLALEALGGYLLARAYVRNYTQFAAAVSAYFLFVLVVGAVAVPEAFLKIKFVHAWASALTGNPDTAVTSEAGRLGLERATSTFDHPILYGAFCATSVGLVWYLNYNRTDRWIRAGVIAFATFCSVSSAPLLAYAMALGFVGWERWTRQISNRAAITIAVAASGFLLIEVFSNRSAVEVIIALIALDSWTAYYRVLIWQNAFVDLSNNPLFGAALSAWTRPRWMTGSVDSFWLVTALSGGLPAALLVGLAVIVMMVKVHARRLGFRETRERWQCRFGWTAAILGLCLQAFTVHYWGSMHSLFFFILGMGAWMTDSRNGLLGVDTTTRAAAPHPMPLRDRPRIAARGRQPAIVPRGR